MATAAATAAHLMMVRVMVRMVGGLVGVQVGGVEGEGGVKLGGGGWRGELVWRT